MYSISMMGNTISISRDNVAQCIFYDLHIKLQDGYVLPRIPLLLGDIGRLCSYFCFTALASDQVYTTISIT